MKTRLRSHQHRRRTSSTSRKSRKPGSAVQPRPRFLASLIYTLRTTRGLLTSLLRLLWLLAQPKVVLAARCLALEKQLARFLERHLQPARFADHDRIALAWLSRLADLRSALVAVKPSTLVRWHRNLWALYWRFSSRMPGRPPTPREVQLLIARMSRHNPTWGAERIQNELLLKLGFAYSPRTIALYMGPHQRPGPGRNVSRERWAAFVRGHAQTVLACDFFSQISLGFKTFYVFVLMEVGSRRILHCNVTRNPTAQWTTQQLRDAIPAEHHYRFLIHDRDGIFSPALDASLKHMGLRVLKSPPRAPQANAFAERLIGTIRRECLDFFIVLGESHLRSILREWVTHYNQARPHQRLGPGIPDPAQGLPVPRRAALPKDHTVTDTPVLGGLHHEYRLEKTAA